MKIIPKIYYQGRKACERAKHSVYTLEENNPYKRGTVEYQNYRKGYLDYYGRCKRI